MLSLVLRSSEVWGKAPFSIRPTPGWVSRGELPSGDSIPEAQVSRGYYSLVWEEQIRVSAGSVERYYHFADKIVSATGVANDSELQVEFDPSYQELTIHRVEILRGGQTIDAFRRADVRVIQHERELERRIFNGRVSLFLPLRDVRVGDRIEFEYSIRGENPIFEGRYADAFALQVSSPCALRRVRLLWPPDRPLFIKTHGLQLEPRTSSAGPEKEFVWELSSKNPISWEDEVPSDVQQVSWLQLSEFSTWAEVARWANRLFEAPQLPDDDWEAAGLSLYQEKPLAERVIAATQFVQDQVRYLAMELGPSSHLPHPPDEVFKKRFGDCKDKALLLVAILRRLGVEGYPALVNTHARQQLDSWQPSPIAFNHAVVYVRVGERDYWIDPTLLLQRGTLDRLTVPPYGRALILSPETSSLTEIQSEPPEEPTEEIEERFVTSDYQAPVELTVTSRYRHGRADQTRFAFSNESITKIGENYLNYYSHRFPKITAQAPPSISDDVIRNELTVVEKYTISDFWAEPSRQFDADVITGRMQKPHLRQRKQPFAIGFPIHVSQRKVIELPNRAPLIRPESTKVDNQFVSFKFSSDESRRTVTLDYHFRTLVDRVPAEAIGEYLAGLATIEGSLGYKLQPRRGADESRPPLPDYSAPMSGLAALLALLAVPGGLLLLLATRNVRNRRRQQGDRHRYAPGEAAETALLLRRSQSIESAVQRVKCSKCRQPYRVASAPAEVLFQGKRLLVVRCSCPSCATASAIYLEAAGETSLSRPSPRRPWVAALLALVCPGMGHLYAGRVGLATAVALVGPVVVCIPLIWGAYQPRALIWLVVVACGLYATFWISQLIWALLLAHRQGANYVLRPRNRLVVYIGFFVACTIAISILRPLIRHYFVEPYRIPSAGMAPALIPGDVIFVVKVGEAAKTRRGDVIVFKNPMNEKLDSIKRVVGVPGDRIKIVNASVYVNGEEQPRRLLDSNYSYPRLGKNGEEEMEEGELYEENLDGRPHQLIQRRSACRNPRKPTCNYEGGQEFTVPEGRFFVLGDDRDNSADSRFGFGSDAVESLVFVPSRNIKGKAALIYLSFSASQDIRWGRIGKPL